MSLLSSELCVKKYEMKTCSGAEKLTSWSNMQPFFGGKGCGFDLLICQYYIFAPFMFQKYTALCISSI